MVSTLQLLRIGVWSKKDLVEVPELPLIGCAMLAKLFNISKLYCPHLYKGDITTDPLRLLWDMNEVTVPSTWSVLSTRSLLLPSPLANRRTKGGGLGLSRTRPGPALSLCLSNTRRRELLRRCSRVAQIQALASDCVASNAGPVTVSLRASCFTYVCFRFFPFVKWGWW